MAIHCTEAVLAPKAAESEFLFCCYSDHDLPPADLAQALAAKGIDPARFPAVTPGDVVEI